MKAVILTYHSHHVVGPSYAQNDHIALPADLAQLTRAGFRIVPLDAIVDALALAKAGDGRDSAAAPLLAITFDDGPVYDLDDFVHPEFGYQRGFVGIMRDFSGTSLGRSQPDLGATSFVIASPEARKVMEVTFDGGYTYLADGALDEAWWPRALETGLLSIANHSWDHLHPALARVAHSADARADFTRVTDDADADAQILAASAYLRERTGGRAVPHFAYPFGHCNAFLATDYLPRRGTAAGVRAAFTTEPRPVNADDNPFRLPRYVCGDHWKSPGELAAILATASR